MLFTATCLSVLAVYGTVKVIQEATDRLGIDTTTVLLWFGLAEWPSEPAQPRRRSPHRLRTPRRP